MSSKAAVKDFTEKRTFKKELAMHGELYLLMIPYFALFFIMFVLPVVVAIGLSFTYYNMFGVPEFRGLTNFINLFVYDEIFYIALKNTLVFALLTGPVSYVLCFLMAWFINEMPKSLRVFLTFVFYAPSISSSVFFIWQFLFSGDSYGLINGLLLNIGFIHEPIQWLTDPAYNLTILIIIQIWMSLGTGFLAFTAGLQGVDRTLYEAGDIDGVRNRFQELLYITLPMVKPQLLFGAVMQIAASFAVSGISMTLCGFPSTNYSAHTIVLHIMDYGTIRYDMGYACAISVVLFALMLIVRKLINAGMRYIADT